jgi:hypothetical protein
MEEEALNNKIVTFFEHIEKYYGCKTEITEGLFCSLEDFDPKNTTWNLSEFELTRSAYRKNGERFMFEGQTMYYEISGERIIDFKTSGRNKYEFVEQYGENVYRITRFRFHYKY